MIRFKIYILTFLSIMSFQLSGATLPFRLGEILSAEISRDKITIENVGKFDYDFGFEHNAYALVVLKLHKGRSLSTYDFKLKLEDKFYKCIALRSGDDTFDTKKWKVAVGKPDELYSLLFIIDSEVLGNAKKTIPMTLVYNISDSGLINYNIPFKFINYEKLTKVEEIPESGTFTRVKIDTKKRSILKKK